MAGNIGCNEGASLRVFGMWVVVGILNKREEYSGVSKDTDLNEDEDDEGREIKSRTKFLISVSMLI